MEEDSLHSIQVEDCDELYSFTGPLAAITAKIMLICSDEAGACFGGSRTRSW
ncbi:MAG: hypothetical protein NUW09_00960 [Deltaproteobacteria bacterium]|nr:hypothetical protein [Deltaproteobacteria bacterium]